MLAGIHLKSISDLGIPLTGVGLLYREGYFHQALNTDDWQMEKKPENDFYQMPVQSVFADSRKYLSIEVPYVDGNVHTRIWQGQVGRVRPYLLNTNLNENSPANRDTARLYRGDQTMRIRQEMLLGIGGLRAP